MKVNGYNLDVVCTNCCGDIYVNLEDYLRSNPENEITFGYQLTKEGEDTPDLFCSIEEAVSWATRKIDKLEQAMQNEAFCTVLSDESFGEITLRGKRVSPLVNDMGYEVMYEINSDGDCSIIAFKNYDRMKAWLDNWRGEGFYDWLVELYKKGEENIQNLYPTIK